MDEPLLLSDHLRAVARDRMSEQGLNAYRLIKLSGVAESRAYRWLRGEYPIDIDDLYLVALVLDLPVSDLMAEAERRLADDLRSAAREPHRPVPADVQADRDAWDAEQAARKARR